MTLSSDLVKPLPICPNRERSGPPNTSKSSATGGYLMIWRVSPCCAWISAGLAAISAGLARSQPVSLPSPLEGSSACLGRETAPCASRTPPFHAPDRLRIPPAAPVGVTGCDLAKPAAIWPNRLRSALRAAKPARSLQSPGFGQILDPKNFPGAPSARIFLIICAV